jgi:hypothetical protein
MIVRPRGRRAAPWLLGLVAALVAATAAAALWSRTPDSEASRFAAPLPSPVVVAQGVSSANAEHVFFDPARDFAMMRPVFNAVSLLPGDPVLVAVARRAGLAVVLEFDYKNEFFAGEDISEKVARVVEQIRAHPRTVSAVHVADRLNEKYTAAEGLRYLEATGGVFHREVPGVPVMANTPDWELTCGLPDQRSCENNDPRFAHETNATLDRFHVSGHLDGLSIYNNLKNFDTAAQRTAWKRARERWPEPFILWSTSSQLSFGASTHDGTPNPILATDAYMRAPMDEGAQGLAIWAWHQLYDGEVYTFLNKDGSTNSLWERMAAVAEQL